MDKIQNYQKQIENILRLNKGRSLKRYESNIKEFLKVDLTKGKISETEYYELIEYMQNKMVEIENKVQNEETEKSESASESDKKNSTMEIGKEEIAENNSKGIEKRGVREEFVEGLKVIKPVIIYKGRINQVAPTRQERKEKGRE